MLYRVIRLPDYTVDYKMNFNLLTGLKSRAISYFIMFLFADYLFTIFTFSRKRAKEKQGISSTWHRVIFSHWNYQSLLNYLSDILSGEAPLHTLIKLVFGLDWHVDILCSLNDFNNPNLVLLRTRLKYR